MKNLIHTFLLKPAVVIALVFGVVSFFLITKSNYKTLEVNSLDPAWSFTIQNPEFGNQLSGRDFYFTYGPLSPLLNEYQYNSTSDWFFIASRIFTLINIAILGFLIYKLFDNQKRKAFLGYMLLIPFLIHLQFKVSLEFEVLAILLLIAIQISKFKRKYLYTFFSVWGSIFLLTKFNIGIYIFVISGMMLILNSKNIRVAIRDSMLYSGASFLLAFLLFIITTGTFGFIDFLLESIRITLGYKEFMAVTFFFGNDHILNVVISLLVIVIPLLYITTYRNKVLYAIIIYFVLNTGWIRNDGHMSLVYLFAMFIFIILLINNIKRNARFIIIFPLMITAAVTLILSVSAMRVIGLKVSNSVNYLTTKIYVPWDIPSVNRENYIKDSENITRGFDKSIIEGINSKKYMLSLPWATHLPKVFNREPLYLHYLQLYQNYNPIAEKESIKNIREVFPDLTILLQDNVIDNRIYLGENPLLLISILKNFNVGEYDKDKLILLPKLEIFEELNLVGSGLQVGEYELISIDIDEPLTDKFFGLIFKKDEICLRVSDKLGNEIIKRTYKSQLKDGILVSPFFDDIKDFIAYKTTGKGKYVEIKEIFKCHTGEKYNFTSQTIFYN